MFYIFNKHNQCISSCNAKPNAEDLATREEFVIEDARGLDIQAARAKCCNEQGDGLHKTSSLFKFILLDFFTMFTLQRLNKD